MQIVRTVLWALLLIGLLLFSFFNWQPVEVQFWNNLVVETRLPVLLVAAFLLGLVPTWLYGRSRRWQLKRRIKALEDAAAAADARAAEARAAANAPPHTPDGYVSRDRPLEAEVAAPVPPRDTAPPAA